MNNIHANSVGIAKTKDIYLIKNTINDKMYVGQSINTEERFKSHCKGNYDNSLIDAAIQKYGKENFYYIILEEQIVDYNEKEKYYIQALNTQTPFGYNIMCGGENPPIFYGENHPNAKISDQDVYNLKQDLKNTNLSLLQLGKKYNVSKRQVLRINQGLSRKTIGEDYPIRKKPNSCLKLTQSDVDEILELLQFSYEFNGTIAKRFNVEVHLISDINQGLAYRQENIEYPIRDWKSCGVVQFTYEQVTEIIELLKNSSLSMRKIAKLYNCKSSAIISQINQGSAKKYRRKNIDYPIRKNN